MRPTTLGQFLYIVTILTWFQGSHNNRVMLYLYIFAIFVDLLHLFGLSKSCSCGLQWKTVSLSKKRRRDWDWGSSEQLVRRRDWNTNRHSNGCHEGKRERSLTSSHRSVLWWWNQGFPNSLIDYAPKSWASEIGIDTCHEGRWSNPENSKKFVWSWNKTLYIKCTIDN